MKKQFYLALLFTVISIALFSGCKKNDKDSDPTPTGTLPTVTTTDPDYISNTSGRCRGNVSADGGATITDKGICYSTSPNPTILNNKLSNGTGKGEIGFHLTNLTASTKYYARAYATNSAGTAYGSEKSFTTAASPIFENGYYYQGGLIFYVDPSGIHGMVAAPYDQGTANWGCQGTNISGTSMAVGTGMANTTKIANSCATTNIAAKLCDQLSLGGYTDWYLPSKDELDLMHENLYLDDLGGFQTNRYWSSTQYDGNNAWCQLFNLNLNQLYYDKDLIAYPVRAARTF